MKRFQPLELKKDGFFDKIPQFLFWAMFTVVLLGITILTAWQPVWANIPLNVLFPIFALVFVNMVFFEKLKLSTLVTLRAIIVLPFLFVFERQIYMDIVLILLIINILEATFTDGLRYKRWFNFVTGIALAASVLVLFKFSFWSNDVPFYSANAATNWATISWIIAYTIWNWVFVTNEFSPSISYLHVGILLVPILGIIIMMNPGYWLLFRANSLTFGGTLQISGKGLFENKLENEKFAKFVQWTKKNSVQIVLMIVNLILIAIPVVLYFM